jgi:hypothetical protein
MKILLGDFNAKVGWEDIFKPTIGNESLHAISKDNGVKNLIVKSTMIPHRNIHKFTWTSDGRTHNQIDHIWIDGRRHSGILDVRSFRAAVCNTVQYRPIPGCGIGYGKTGSELTKSAQSSYGEVHSRDIKRGRQ